MNSDFEMAEMHQKPLQQKKFMAENTSSSPSVYFPINPNHNFLQQENPFPFTQPFFQEHHFIQPFFDPVRENNFQAVANNNNLLLPLSFKLGSGHESQINNGLGEGDGGGRGGDALVHRSCHGGSPDVMIQCWDNQEDSALKQRFWKPLSAEFPNGNEKECSKETDGQMRKEQEMSQYNQETEHKSKYGFFDGELEAIYRQADIAETAQTASGSALTAENFPAGHSRMPDYAEAVKGKRKRKRGKLMKDEEYTPMGEFFESLVKRLMDHQEDLHNKFLETIERLDRERVEREEAWRQQELMNLEREADARASHRALASTREVAILSYLEKITGQKIILPPKEPPPTQIN